MFPSFYKASAVGTVFTPDTLRVVTEAHRAAVSPASQDTTRIALLLIDMQVDFIHTEGALSVTGAIADTQRTIEWLFNHMGRVTTIAASLDSHLPVQIFSPSWWADSQGNHPDPYTVITHADVEHGHWLPLYDAQWSRYYTKTLEQQAKKQLMIWPYHTLIGTYGHALTPALYEAIAYHAAARAVQPILLQKGSDPRTEHYSILEPDVKPPDHHLPDNHPFVDMLNSHDLIFIAGQAKSHCVLETISSLMRYNPLQTIPKLRLLMDAMSSVQHPQIDFDALADETFANYVQQGLTLTTTRDTF